MEAKDSGADRTKGFVGALNHMDATGIERETEPLKFSGWNYTEDHPGTPAPDRGSIEVSILEAEEKRCRKWTSPSSSIRNQSEKSHFFAANLKGMN